MNILIRLSLLVSIMCIQSSNILAMHQADSEPQTTEKINNEFIFKITLEPSSSNQIPAGLEHYAQKMDSFIKNEFNGATQMNETEFSNAFFAAEKKYFSRIQPVVQHVLSRLHPDYERMLFCMNRYTS